MRRLMDTDATSNHDGVEAKFESALKFPLHSISLILIYCYLVVNTFFEGFSDNNLRGTECTCKSKDQVFYRIVYWSSCAVWWISVIITFSCHIG